MTFFKEKSKIDIVYVFLTSIGTFCMLIIGFYTFRCPWQQGDGRTLGPEVQGTGGEEKMGYVSRMAQSMDKAM
jgi:hypothetical protein